MNALQPGWAVLAEGYVMWRGRSKGEEKETNCFNKHLFNLPQRAETTQKALAELEGTGSFHLTHTGLSAVNDLC